MGNKFEELKTIVELLREWAVEHGEQSNLTVFIMDDWTNVFNDFELPEGKQFDMSIRDGQWIYNKTPAAESAGESSN